MRYLNKFIHWLTHDRNNPNRISLDYNVLFSSILLLTIGLIMVYSASVAYAAKDSGNSNQYFYVVRHIVAIAFGLVAGIITFNVPTRFWKKNANKIMVIILFLLVLVLIPHIGKVVNGARRWIPLIFFNLQPSELAKLAMAMYMANYYCVKSLDSVRFMRDIFPSLAIIVLTSILLLAEPDMGSTTVVFIIALTILFLAGVNLNFVLYLLGIGVVAFVVLIVITPYRVKRVVGFLNPWDDALGKGYQLTHSLLAFGHGGWLGVGLGNSIEKLYYLPEAHTDFIMAIIGEEFGVVGVLVILILFWILFYRGFTVIAGETKKMPGRKFQTLLAQGISTWFFAQAIVNIGVAIGMLPTKGLTLPFVSFGGSSILVNCMAIGILLKIDFENKSLKHGLQI